MSMITFRYLRRSIIAHPLIPPIRVQTTTVRPPFNTGIRSADNKREPHNTMLRALILILACAIAIGPPATAHTRPGTPVPANRHASREARALLAYLYRISRTNTL